MAAWLLTISKNYPEHWDYAKRDGLWDMISNRRILAGDVVYYWQSGASLLGKVRVLDDAYDIDPATAEPGPWKDWPGSEEKPYRWRFSLEVLAGSSVGQPSWTEVHQATGLSKNASFVRTLAQEQQSVLDRFIGGSFEPQPTLDDARRERIFNTLDDDLRVRRYQLVALRQGQPRFRNGLLRAYEGRCAISGTATESVLEAAHIKPHKGEQSNEIWNGLLLRADLHTLFDLFLITVEADSLRVRVAPSLAGSEYAEFEDTALTVPATLDHQPDREALADHNDECTWL